MKLNKLTSVVALTLLLTGCWPFGNDTQTAPTAAVDPQQTVNDAVRAIGQSQSFHADATVQATATATNEVATFFVSVNSDVMKVPVSTTTASAQTHSSITNSDTALHLEFQTAPVSAPPTKTAGGNIKGSLDVSVTVAQDTTYLKITKAYLADPESQLVIDHFLKPYLNKWIAFPSPKDKEAMGAFSPLDALKQKLGTLGTVAQQLADENGLTPEQQQQIATLATSTNFFIVTDSGTPSTTTDMKSTAYTITLDRAGLMKYLGQIGEIMKEPMPAETKNAIRAALDALKLSGTITIDETNRLPSQITMNGSLDSKKLPRDLMADAGSGPGNDFLLTFKAAVAYSEYGKSFTITEPPQYEQFEAILEKIFAPAMDLEGEGLSASGAQVQGSGL